jgi:hypothetical protein
MNKEDIRVILFEAIAILFAIGIVSFMVHQSDVRKKESIPYRASVRLLDK